MDFSWESEKAFRASVPSLAKAASVGAKNVYGPGERVNVTVPLGLL